MTPDTSGPGFSTPFAFYDPTAHFLKTSQGTFLSDSIESSLTLPASGGMHSGRLSPRAPWGLHRCDAGCSVWPTPRVAASRTSRRAAVSRGSRSGPSIEQAIELRAGILPRELNDLDEAPESWRRMWPTPRATMGHTQVRPRPEGKEGGAQLEEVVAVRENRNGGYLNPRWIEWLMGFPMGWCEPPSKPSETQ